MINMSQRQLPKRHVTIVRDEHPYAQRDLNSQSNQSSCDDQA